MLSAPRPGTCRRIPLRTAILVIAVFAPIAAFAQSGSVGPLQEKYDKKLAEPFVKAVKWATTLEEARTRAREENKPIVGYFTRSYAP